jgi:hypothetical protein
MRISMPSPTSDDSELAAHHPGKNLREVERAPKLSHCNLAIQAREQEQATASKSR